MQKLLKASLLLIILSILHSQAFASVNCEFTSNSVSGIKSIELTANSILINGKTEIELEKSDIQCGALGWRDRYDGTEKNLKIILKDCTRDNSLQGQIIDSAKQEIADIECT